MIVITGAGGFIGRNLANHFSYDNFTQFFLLYHRLNDIDDAIQFDVADSRYWRQIPNQGVDYVIHCAGALMIDGHSPENYFRVNAIGTFNALEYCRRVGAKMIYLQTHSDVNNCKGVYIDEETPRSFISTTDQRSVAFVASKIAAVEMVEAYTRKGDVEGVILRLANVRGVGSQDTKYNCYFHQMIQKAIKGEPIELWGKLQTIRDFVYVKDVCRAVEAVIRCNAPAGLYNIGSGRGWTWEEEVKAIIKVFSSPGKESQLIYRPEIDEVRKHSCVFRRSKAFETFGWKPIYSYEKGLEDMKTIMEKGLI